MARDFENLFKVEIGREIKLCHLTLTRGENRGKNQASTNVSKSHVTPGETNILIDLIGELGNRGFPLSHRRLREHINKILQARLGDKFPQGSVGKQWKNHFVKKHSDRIKMLWSAGLESKKG